MQFSSSSEQNRWTKLYLEIFDWNSIFSHLTYLSYLLQNEQNWRIKLLKNYSFFMRFCFSWLIHNCYCKMNVHMNKTIIENIHLTCGLPSVDALGVSRRKKQRSWIELDTGEYRSPDMRFHCRFICIRCFRASNITEWDYNKKNSFSM